MELYACGFNAWNQLRFEGSTEEEPHDVEVFRCVLKYEHIQVLRASLSSTLVKTTSALRLAGMPDDLTKLIYENPDIFLKVAEAGNGHIASASGHQRSPKVCQYKAWTEYPDRHCDAWDLGDVQQIVSGHTGFTALSAGEVWTWGDARYSACLGRDSATAETSSAHPGLVSDLQDLPTGPIAKIASGSYMTAALTAGQDLYLWGVNEALQLGGTPAPIDLEGMDVLDMGVGDGHVIVLTADQRVWVVGEGANGQLGERRGTEKLADWKEVDLKLGAGREVVGVASGPKCSFVLVKMHDSEG